jgi:hypothetical protein
LDDVSVVLIPEPSSGVLAAAGLLGLAVVAGVYHQAWSKKNQTRAEKR